MSNTNANAVARRAKASGGCFEKLMEFICYPSALFGSYCERQKIILVTKLNVLPNIRVPGYAKGVVVHLQKDIKIPEVNKHDSFAKHRLPHQYPRQRIKDDKVRLKL